MADLDMTGTPFPPPSSGIMVTRATLPPLDEYVAYLRTIWQSHWLTNNGPLARELEERLRALLACPHLWFVGNGTLALQLAVKGLGLQGEVITTPFSYVATTGTLVWEGCTPVFVDVRPQDLTIDPTLLEAAITPRTTAILATHVYGLPCAVHEIQAVARRHGLKVIYDAAHAFGCRLGGRALTSYGDVSCLSFHATKVFHTVEGGAVIINGDAALAERVRLMRAFGHYGDDHRCAGLNAKNTEFHAAMGLCNLPRMPATLAERRQQYEHYARLLDGSTLRRPVPAAEEFDYNYSYFPILLQDEPALLRAVAGLARIGVHARRYFYPSLNQLPYVRSKPCPVAEQAAATVLCLPLSSAVTPEDQERIAATLRAVV